MSKRFPWLIGTGFVGVVIVVQAGCAPGSGTYCQSGAKHGTQCYAAADVQQPPGSRPPEPTGEWWKSNLPATNAQGASAAAGGPMGLSWKPGPASSAPTSSSAAPASAAASSSSAPVPPPSSSPPLTTPR